MSLSSLLNTTITLRRKTTTVDSSMGGADTFTDVSSMTDVPASVQPIKASERYILAQRGIWATHRIYLDQDIGATPRDQIRTADGKLFNIVFQHDQAGRERVWMIECKEQA